MMTPKGEMPALKGLFDHVVEPLCYFNADGALEYANAAGRSILGIADMSGAHYLTS